MSQYVALGSSFASGPGLPRGSAYPHLVADRLGLELRDVSRSGATTEHVLRKRQGRRRPQIAALDGSEELVTVTIAGNDVGMSLRTLIAGLPGWVRGLPVVRSRVAATFDPAAYEGPLAGVGASLREVAHAIRVRSPRARVVVVDYLTVLPPSGVPTPPLSSEHADVIRHIAARLRDATAEAAAAEGCILVSAAAASADHHAWSDEPWTAGAGWPLPRRPVAFHPNASGMRAVADLVVQSLG
jgi:lysophospholipase L1-like esterase